VGYTADAAVASTDCGYSSETHKVRTRKKD